MKNLLLFFFFFLLPFLSTSLHFPTSLLRSTKQARNFNINVKAAYDTRYYTQTLDHFNYRPEGYATFQQKYLINDKHWGGVAETAPIFVYCGNEGDIELFAENTGFMFDVAPYFKALVIFIEHRYYGESIPYGGNKEVAFANASTLGYLSTTQGLADYATLITDLKNNLTCQQCPVVSFGGSLGGMLAAWFRLKYPHVTIGALASSAPILGFYGLMSPYSFNNIVTNDFKSESENCYNVLKNSWTEIEAAGKDNAGIKKLSESFKICNGEAYGSSLANYIENWMETAMTYAAMTDYPTPTDFLTSLPAYPVKTMCKAIDNPTAGNDTFSKLYGAMSVYYNNSGNAGTCFDLGSKSSSLGLDGWSFQSCTEVLLPTNGCNEECIFPPSTDNLTERAESCRDTYGIWPRPYWLTTEFGGYDIRRVLKRFGSNIIFFNGLRDPWSGGGVLESISKSIVAIVAPDGAHHVDLRSATKEDPEWLKKIRRKEMNIIQQWLNQYYSDSK